MAATAGSSTSERSTLAQITEFLEHRRFAAVGVSRDPKEFTRRLLQEFADRGYDLVPVNPGTTELAGIRCFARVQDITPRVDAALILTAPNITEQVVRDCVKAGVTHIWMYRAGGAGAVSAKAVEFCREHRVNVIAGECPLMYLPNPGFPHRVHGLVRKILRTYPR